MSRHTHESVDPIRIEPPDIESMDSKDFMLSYDQIVDTLFIYFVPGDINPISVLVDPDNDIYALVDADSREIIGVQLEAYLARIVYEWPEFLSLAIWAGISLDRLEPVIQQIAGQPHVSDQYHEVQRRFFDLSVKEQIERFFHSPGGGRVAATV